MTDQFLAEIRIFAGNFAPTGWAMCDGQLMSISQNTALFSLLGTTYGGDGKTTFALPNLQGSAAMHAGQGAGLSQQFLGETGGEQTVTLLDSEMPVHSHGAQAFAGAGGLDPAGNAWAEPNQRGLSAYAPNSANNAVSMSPNSLSINGGSQPHNNMMPFLGLTFIIALTGIFPARS